MLATMTTFPEMAYARPDFDAVLAEMNALLDDLRAAPSGEAACTALEALDSKFKRYYTLRNLAEVRHTIDTRDPFYEAENDAFDEADPRFEEITTERARAALQSPHRDAIAERFGEHLLEKYEVAQRTFTPEILDELVEENKLSSAYQKLTSSAEIQFEGETRNLSGMTPFMESADREMRRRASAAMWGWFADHQDELDDLFDKLVKIRHRIGQKLGHDTFIPVAYARMGRTDWDQADAKRYRDQIATSVVPLAQKLRREQAARIGIADPKYFDQALMFTSGNPKPQGEEAELVDAAAAMYRELSPDTDEFFTMMIDRQLMDLTTKPGKAPGGYMTSFDEYKAPFIFSNFNGTSGDVDVLTHEAGHAFQGWLHRDDALVEIADCTAEVAEIHSMSMEFFTHPWMERFFGPDTDKYYYSHVVDAIQFLPYGASIDELQEWIYEHPEATPAERRATYRDIERKYLPHLDYDGVEYLEAGGRWQKQLHVYNIPFYYLDYTLSQVVALQYLAWDRRDHDAAWKSYVDLCTQSGLVAFKQLVPASGLRSPFDDGTIAALIPEIESYLATIDHANL